MKIGKMSVEGEGQPHQFNLEEIVEAATRAAINARPTNVGEQHPSYSDIGSQIPIFGETGDEDIDIWIQRVDEIKTAYSVSDSIIKVLATKQLKGKVREWYNYAPNIVNKPWNDLKAELRKMFGSCETRLSLMKRMEARRWRSGEVFTNYFYEKVRLLNRLHIEEVDSVAYVIDGIDNYVLRTHALAAAYTTLADLLTAMKIMSEDKPFRGKEKAVDASKKPVEGTKRPTATSTVVRCFNCNETGHISTRCPKPQRPKGACYRCGSTNHQAKDCQQGQARGAVTTARPTTAANEVTSSTALTVKEARIESKYTLPIVMCGKTVSALLDTGSVVSLIKRSCFDQLFPLGATSDSLSHVYEGINRSVLNVLGETDIKIKLMFINLELTVNFKIVEDHAIPVFVLLGQDFLETPGLSVTFADKVYVGYLPPVLCAADQEEAEIRNIMNINCVDEQQEMDIRKKINPVIKEECIREVEGAIGRYQEARTKPTAPKVDYEMRITLKRDIPFSCTPRRLSWYERQRLQETINNLLEKGIIRRSQSTYASPIVLVKKKDGGIRKCCDYRVLNGLCVKEPFPIPVIDDCMDRLRGKKYFTSLDLKAGFHHVRMAEDSIKYTSFVTPDGQYEYLRMPFGLVNAPANFMRFLTTIFRGLLEKGEIIIYFDDLLIATETIEESTRILKEVLDLMAENKLELRLDKCLFLHQRLVFLGYEVSHEGIQVSKMHTRAIMDFPMPRSAKEVHRFLGMTGYLRRFIPNYALIAKPLFRLIRKDEKFDFGEIELRAYEDLKGKLVSPPILSIYSPTVYTELHTDASAAGYGAILLQRQNDSKMHPIFYYSRRTTEVESRYHSYELETLAIVYALERFRIYLLGIKFVIITDCNALKMTLAKKELNPRIARWALLFQNYDYEIMHRKGERMQHVDALSRSILIIEPTSFEQNLIYKQMKDEDIKKIMQQLEEGESSRFEARNGVLYRKFKENVLFYVPRSMEQQIMRACHDDVGHVGADKTAELIQKVYWFPRMKEIVKEYISNCLKCIVYSSGAGKKEGRMQIVEKGKKPFHTLHIDHFGPLEKTSGGNKYVLVIIDAFSKYCVLQATKSVTAKESVAKLEQYFRHFGEVHVIVSDRGTAFTAEEFSKFVTKYDVQHVKVASASPQSNGQVERINRFMKSILMKSGTTTTWDEELRRAQFVINNTYNRAVGNTPSMLLFGVEQRGFSDEELREFIKELQNVEVNLEQIREEANEKNRKLQEYNKTRYDLSHKEPTKYKEGDFVVIKNVVTESGVNRKLLPNYKGPYEVTKVLDKDRYVLSDIEGFHLTQRPFSGIYAPDRMRLWDRD